MMNYRTDIAKHRGLGAGGMGGHTDAYDPCASHGGYCGNGWMDDIRQDELTEDVGPSTHIHSVDELKSMVRPVPFVSSSKPLSFARRDNVTIDGQDGISLDIALRLLKFEEGDSVNILCENPEPKDSESFAIVCNGGWTDWKDRRFYGESTLDCLRSAAVERMALRSGSDEVSGPEEGEDIDYLDATRQQPIDYVDRRRLRELDPAPHDQAKHKKSFTFLKRRGD